MDWSAIKGKANNNKLLAINNIHLSFRLINFKIVFFDLPHVQEVEAFYFFQELQKKIYGYDELS